MPEIKIAPITAIRLSIFNILNINIELDCEIDKNMTIDKNNQIKTLNLIQILMKNSLKTQNGVSKKCLKKYLLIRQIQIKPELQLQKMIN